MMNKHIKTSCSHKYKEEGVCVKVIQKLQPPGVLWSTLNIKILRDFWQQWLTSVHLYFF